MQSFLNRRMEFRIGVNLGDVIEDGEQILGDGVNIAARLESLSEAGGICISGTAFDQVRNKLELGYEYLGEQTVKNIALPVRVYKVLTFHSSPGKAEPKKWLFLFLINLLLLCSLLSTSVSTPNEEYFSDGITENIIAGLSKITGLFVIARNSTFFYKGKGVKVQQVAEELGVRYVLEGGVQR